MLEKRTIAYPYAQAAFAQASEEDALADWSDMLALLAVITSDEQMQLLMRDPRVSIEQMKSLVTSVAGDVLTKTGTNFVSLLVDAGRLSVCVEINELFEERKAEAEQYASVQVISAYEMDEGQQQKIVDVMRKRLNRSVDVTIEQDKDLIGGAVITVGDTVIDLSLRGRLNAMVNEFN